MPTRDPKRYATLLRVRKQQEDLEAQRLGVVMRQLQSVEAEREQIERDQRRAFEDASEEARGRIQPTSIIAYHHYERLLSDLAVMKDAKARELGEAIRTQRGVVEETWKKRRIVEQLTERLEAEMTLEQNREEVRAMDETSIMRARHRADSQSAMGVRRG